jgi:hypothetical protein
MFPLDIVSKHVLSRTRKYGAGHPDLKLNVRKYLDAHFGQWSWQVRTDVVDSDMKPIKLVRFNLNGGPGIDVRKEVLLFYVKFTKMYQFDWLSLSRDQMHVVRITKPDFYISTEVNAWLDELCTDQGWVCLDEGRDGVTVFFSNEDNAATFKLKYG